MSAAVAIRNCRQSIDGAHVHDRTTRTLRRFVERMSSLLAQRL
ncbi:MAG: hypothetical protein ACOC3D_11685 [Pseudomonadota bacterium]